LDVQIIEKTKKKSGAKKQHGGHNQNDRQA
jgi:hypothetical protein